MPTLDHFREFMAAQAKATPGPYALRPNEFDDWGVVRSADGLPIGTFATSSLIYRWKEHLAPNVDRATWSAGPPQAIANAELFIAARSLPVAELLAERERMEIELTALRAKLEAAEKERNDAVRSYGRTVHKRIEAMAILRSLIHCIEQLMGDSEGVAGLHMNGDVAPWSELVRGGRYEEWLEAFDTAREWIASQDHQVVDQDERTGG